MIRRCYQEDVKNYYLYGGRGIKVCDEWFDYDNGFNNFYKWAMDNGYSDNLTLDRIDVNGDYNPSNCRWITNEEQAKNRRSNRYLTYNGETKLFSEWCEKINIPESTLRNRLKRGWSVERALNEKVHKKAS